jgi:hypothetical protein
MKDVLYYSTQSGHEISDDVVVVGLCPSSNDVRSRSDTYWRLKNWMNIVGQYAYDFYNVIPDIVDADPKMANVNLEDINTKLSKFRGKKVIALGNFASKVLDKLDIDHLKIGHPSMRNRKWNDFHNVTMELENMRDYLRGTH